MIRMNPKVGKFYCHFTFTLLAVNSGQIQGEKFPKSHSS
uniref:Uncharacterized protein n=1 Tax=Arundo donax TaxID=35708 RepID=A0A0A9EY93_ARUDO